MATAMHKHGAYAGEHGAGVATVGEQLAASPAVNAAVDALVAEVRRHSAQITDVRPPQGALKETYEGLMNRAADVRGKPLLYPYIGSGIGNGALVELADGSIKWDLITGIGVHFFGHSDPDLTAAAVRGARAPSSSTRSTATVRPSGLVFA